MIDEKKLLRSTPRLGVNTPSDLLFLCPKSINDYTKTVKIDDVEMEEKGFFKLKALKSAKMWSSNSGFNLTATDGIQIINLMVHGIAYEISKLKPGDFFYCTGKKVIWNNMIQLQDVKWINQRNFGRIVCEYKNIPKIITSERVAEKVKIVYENYLDEAVKRVLNACHVNHEQEVIEGSHINFPNVRSFFKALHFPESKEDYENAIEASKNISCFEIISIANQQDIIEIEESIIDVDMSEVSRLIGRAPFTLTNDQGKAIADIINDMQSSRPMNRLLSGDVGTGKTIAYIIPAVAAHKAGKKVAVVVQSFLVASQVANEMRESYPETDIIFRAGYFNKKDKKELAEKSKNGNPIIVGTSAVIHSLEKLDYPIDLLIVDEQQKMGREQREKLKDNHTNVLECTATAIPRTMAIISHGGMDVSFLRDKPVHKIIKTVIWEEQQQKEMFNEIKKTIESGFQCALVYPAVDESDKETTENDGENKKSASGRKLVRHATEAFQMFNKIFPDNVALLHGKMKDSEKKEILTELKANKKQLLIASSVIEIGVTLPSMMMVGIIDPDVHGVTALHQLRGRVDRNGKITAEGLEAKFILLVRRIMTDKIRDRLNILVDHDDGFMVAEKDMLQRGFGELSGDKQSGSTSSVFLNVKLTPQDINDFVEKYTYISIEDL